MKDVNCPYCNAEIEINHDDGYGCEESETYEQECGKCEKIFHYTTSISFYYDVEKAPCKNGEPHDWQAIHGAPAGYFSNRERCSYCQEERSKDDTLKYNGETDCWVANKGV